MTHKIVDNAESHTYKAGLVLKVKIDGKNYLLDMNTGKLEEAQNE